MPLPNPEKDETQDNFISRCIKSVKDSDPNRPQDQVVAICFSQWKESKKMSEIGKILHIQSFLWKDGEVQPCPCEGPKFKSFKWVPELKMPSWAVGRLYQFSTLASPKTVDNQVFDDAQKNRCAASITGAPINIDHEVYNLPGQNVVLDADVEEARLEGLCYVEDPKLNALYDEGQIAGCSIDYFDRGSRPLPDGTMGVKGTLCIGLAFVTKEHLGQGFVLGDPNSVVQRLTKEIADLQTRLTNMAKEAADKLTEQSAIITDLTKKNETLSTKTTELQALADSKTAEIQIQTKKVIDTQALLDAKTTEAQTLMVKVTELTTAISELAIAKKPEGHEVETLTNDAFAFVGDNERKLQIKDAEDKYDANLLAVAVAELAKIPPEFPEAVLPVIREKLRAGYTALTLAIPDVLNEKRVKTLEEILDPKVMKKLTLDIRRRQHWRERFQLFRED